LDCFPKFVNSDDISYKNFSITKLNGTAGLFWARRQGNPLFNVADYLLQERDYTLIEKILVIYGLYSNSDQTSFLSSFFKFAWDENPVSTKALNRSVDILSKTELLIIVGYSNVGHPSTLYAMPRTK
jgi:hypothetical protein